MGSRYSVSEFKGYYECFGLRDLLVPPCLNVHLSEEDKGHHYIVYIIYILKI